MTTARFDHIERLYAEAMALEAGQRAEFVAEACGGDTELRQQVEALLDQATADELLEMLATELLAELATIRLTPGTQLGPYRIEGLLGAGGMGEVYLAYDPRLGRRVAIKLLPDHLRGDPVAEERLRREALAAAALDHPFLCKIFEVARDAAALYVVMEYVRGQSLFERMRAGRLPLHEALALARETAEAIEEAHANHVVHRDLKPANIIVTPQGHVKVMDFGLAKRMEPQPGAAAPAPLTGSGVISGTPQYMSPEQAAAGVVDHRSDLFSFGIILAEMITGRHPFERGSSLETVAAIMRDPPELATDDAVPAGLILLVRRLLAKQPEDRYESAGAIRVDLAAIAAGRPVQSDTPTIRLIGRDQERARVLSLLDAALEGRGSFVLVSGEPGIGKTCFGRAILDAAARRACVTAVGHCYESEGAPPYIPFIEMLEHTAKVLPRETLRRALGDATPEVAKLMPRLRSMFPDAPAAIVLPPEQQRRYFFNAYREFSERIAGFAPCAVMFEDLQWADEPTLQLLQHLLRTLPSVPALWIGTYRDVDVDVSRPFARTLEAVFRDKQATHVPLRRLPLEGTSDLLASLSGQAPPASAARIVHDQTNGNPFFVEEVFRQLSEEGRLFEQGGHWQQGISGQLHVPQGVRLVIGRRLERLGEQARSVLTTAAVIGRNFSVPLLEQLEVGRPDAALEAVEQAERAFLVEAANGAREPRYRFVHELIRQTLAGTLSLPRRQRLHARIAGAIERIYAANLDVHASALAHHLYQAGAAADCDKTIEWLTRAGKQGAAASAFEDAVAHFDHAVSLLDTGQGDRMAEVCVERATVLRSLGRMPEAVTDLERALALFRQAGEDQRFVATSLVLLEVLWWTVRLEEAGGVCRRALDALGTAESPLRPLLLFAAASLAALSNDMAAARPLLDQACTLPVWTAPGLDRLVARIETMTRFTCTQLEEACKRGAECARLCESAGDVWGQADVAWVRAAMAINLGRLDEGASIAREAIPLSERIGHWGNAFFCRELLYNARFAAGDLECAGEAAAFVEEYERLHFAPWCVKTKVDLANVARLRGRIGEAVEWCRRAQVPEPNHWAGYPRAALALALVQGGDAGAADALADALRYALRAGEKAPYGRWPTLNLLIEALATAGRLEDAAALAPATEDMLALGFRVMWAGAALPRTAAGIAAACAREWDRAERHHQAAIEQADTMSLRVCQPIARYWYASMLLARAGPGDPSRSLTLFSEAQSMFLSLGIPLYARRAGEQVAALR